MIVLSLQAITRNRKGREMAYGVEITHHEHTENTDLVHNQDLDRWYFVQYRNRYGTDEQRESTSYDDKHEAREAWRSGFVVWHEWEAQT